MQICIQARERPAVLRQFVDALARTLDGRARIWAFLTAGQEDVDQDLEVFVDVFNAPSEEAALMRVQPALRVADPDSRIMR